MEKINLYDLASILVSKYAIDKSSARNFIQAFVETIHEGVRNDRQVKIKGLGTFKIIGVESRESVNVNTGERVLIGSHDKLTFTPDASMKELVNRPFSQFETVIVNEGVSFDEIDDLEVDIDKETTDNQPADADEQTTQGQYVTEEVKSEADTTVTTVSETLESAIAKETPTVEVPAEDDASFGKLLSAKTILLLVCVAIVSLLMGFFVGRHVGAADNELMADNTLETEDHPSDSLATATDSLLMAPQGDSTETATALPVDVKQDSVPFYKQFEAKDARVRTGAYRIVGTSKVIHAREGQTIKRIARSILGEGMECYLEVYNDIKATEPLKDGQEIKIPKLQWKQKARNKN